MAKKPITTSNFAGMELPELVAFGIKQISKEFKEIKEELGWLKMSMLELEDEVGNIVKKMNKLNERVNTLINDNGIIEKEIQEINSRLTRKEKKAGIPK